MPANEIPWHKEARSGFRNRWFEQFPHVDKDAPIYQDVTHSITPPGIEYYLPLFFEQTATLFDYLPGETLVFTASGLNEAASAFDADTRARYEDRRHDRMRPILPPAELFLQKDELFGLLKGFPRVTMTTEATESTGGSNCQTDIMPDVAMDGRAGDPAGRLKRFISEPRSVLLGTDSFWQGVDVAGDTLSCVVIDKLPFASPGDPLTAARMENIAENDGNPFSDYQVPLAILALLQGLGRLLRHRSDRGVLALLDPRLRTKGYGKRFLDSIPPAPITRKLSDVDRFFNTLETESTKT